MLQIRLDQYKNMKIYLLILALVILSHAKFRNLKIITINSSTSPKIICISPDQLAYQYQSYIVTYNLTNQQVLQNVTLTQPSSIQILPSRSALLYLNNKTLYQIHSTAEDQDYNSTISTTSWPSQISSYQNKFISAIYEKAGQPATFKIYGPKPWDVVSIQWNGVVGSNITGGSELNMVGENQFYFAYGGTCNGADGSIYLQKGSKDSIQNIYTFKIGTCAFTRNNRDWMLQTYQANNTNYHLLTYVSNQGSPYRHTSQLVSSENGNFKDLIHFEIDRLIGVSLVSEQIVYTADNLFCRVVRHDIQNHQHQHRVSAFTSKPITMFVTPSQSLIVTTQLTQDKTVVQAVIYKVDENQTITPYSEYIVSDFNIVRAQILSQIYLFYFSNITNSSLSLYNIYDSTKDYNTNVYGVVDFCVTNLNNVFVLYSTNGLQILALYSMVDDVLIRDASVPMLGLLYESISCLNDDHVLLNPVAGELMQIYQYTTTTKTLNKQSTLLKDASNHAFFNYANDILIFTNINYNQTLFYNYSLAPINQTFNLPPSSAYEIIQARKGELIIAIGSEADTYASLQYYKNQNSILVYKGSFPFLDDGTADISKTVLLPSKGALHLQFQSQSGEWSTYFDLASPPLQSIGYFYDVQNNDCSLFNDAVFRVTPKIAELLLINNNNQQYPVLQKYQITSKLTKTQSYSLNKYSNTKLGLQLTNNNELIIRGLLINSTFNFEVRNLDLLSTIIYSNGELNSLDKVDLQALDYVNEVMISLFSTNKTTYQMIDLLFSANTQNPLPLQTSIFTAVTSFAACPACDKIAFTGPLQDTAAKNTIVVGDYTDPTFNSTVLIDCPAEILALSPKGSIIAWSCANSTLFAYDYVQNISFNITYPNYTNIYQLSFLGEYTLLANLDQVVKSINIPIFISPNNDLTSSVNAGLNNSFAIDYTHQIYAVVTNASTISIYNFVNNTLAQTFTINNTLEISSLSFNSNGQLYVANSVGTVFAITPAPCSIDQYLSSSNYCVCKQLFIQNGDQCSCSYKYSGDGFCLCEDGSFSTGYGCNSCSSMCSTCNSGDSFDCIDFSAGFYVLIVGASLVVVGVVILIIFKMRKRSRKDDSMFTQQKTRLNDPIKPNLKQQVMIRSSFE